jgi:hypothetical protein
MNSAISKPHLFFLCVVYLLFDNKGLRAGAPLAVVLVAFS